jgi:hypothetical protein
MSDRIPNAARRPRALYYLLAMLLSVTLAHASAHAQGQPRPTNPNRPAPKKPGRLLLRNTLYDSIRVEVRAGTATDCAQNVLLGSFWIKRARTWSIRTASTLCWRREQTPGAGLPVWTAWAIRTVGPDATFADIL